MPTSDKPSGARRTEPATTTAADPATEAKTGYEAGEGERVTFEGDGVAVIVTDEIEDDAKAPARRNCVVDEGKDTIHMGQAIPGTKVCSYHTAHYHNDGTLRTGVTNRPTKAKAG